LLEYFAKFTLGSSQVHPLCQIAKSTFSKWLALSLSLSLSLSFDFMVLWTLRKEALSKFKLPSRLAELHWHMLSLLSTTLLLCKGMMSGSILKAMTPLDFPSNNHNLLDELLFHESTAFHP